MRHCTLQCDFISVRKVRWQSGRALTSLQRRPASVTCTVPSPLPCALPFNLLSSFSALFRTFVSNLPSGFKSNALTVRLRKHSESRVCMFAVSTVCGRTFVARGRTFARGTNVRPRRANVRPKLSGALACVQVSFRDRGPSVWSFVVILERWLERCRAALSCLGGSALCRCGVAVVLNCCGLCCGLCCGALLWCLL